MRTKAPLLLISLFALGACITNSEVGVYPHDDTAEPPPGQLPSPTKDDAGVPETETGVPDVHPLSPARNRIAAGAWSTCAIESTGRVVCWGDNSHGQLGMGSSAVPSCPDNYVCGVYGLEIGVDAVFGGGFAHCALKKDGNVACWGDTVVRQSEDGVYNHAVTYYPRSVPELTDVATVGIGLYFQCALTFGKSTKCYGLNSAGQLGNKTMTDAEEPVEVSGMGNQGRKLAAAQSGYFACAVTNAGGLKCWGANGHGQLGNGTRDRAKEATSVFGLDAKVAAVAAGSDHACAVVGGGVRCWGRNDEGQLGDGTDNEKLTPVAVPGLSNIVALTAGTGHTCALSKAGAVYCWGTYGGGTPSLTPVLMIESGVAEVVAGSRHVCALYTDGWLQCWGANDSGQLGPFSGRGQPLH